MSLTGLKRIESVMSQFTVVHGGDGTGALDDEFTAESERQLVWGRTARFKCGSCWSNTL